MALDIQPTSKQRGWVFAAGLTDVKVLLARRGELRSVLRFGALCYDLPMATGMDQPSLDPASADGWIVIARERGADAAAMLPQRQDSTGPVYMAGYAIECALKAYLTDRGIARPAGGRTGHDLRGLWKTSGFRLADLNDPQGTKSFYVEGWSTDLRYRHRLDTPRSTAEMVEGARVLSSWIQMRLKRPRRRRR